MHCVSMASVGTARPFGGAKVSRARSAAGRSCPAHINRRTAISVPIIGLAASSLPCAPVSAMVSRVIGHWCCCCMLHGPPFYIVMHACTYVRMHAYVHLLMLLHSGVACTSTVCLAFAAGTCDHTCACIACAYMLFLSSSSRLLV
jgi:hypothetical protein